MKLSNLSFVLAFMLASNAGAQPLQPIPVNPVRRDPHPTHDPSLYVGDGKWMSPAWEQIEAAWPKRALKEKVDGRVVVDCLIAPNGYLTDCDIEQEEPQGYGFGEATVRLLEKYAHVDPATVPGGLKPDSRKKWTFNWDAG